nr:MAG TPA: hypothetical protein [Bacteriophage sp.]
MLNGQLLICLNTQTWGGSSPLFLISSIQTSNTHPIW